MFSGLERGDGKHLAPDFEDQVVSPLHLFGGVGKREALLPDPLDAHSSQLTPTRAVG